MSTVTSFNYLANTLGVLGRLLEELAGRNCSRSGCWAVSTQTHWACLVCNALEPPEPTKPRAPSLRTQACAMPLLHQPTLFDCTREPMTAQIRSKTMGTGQ